MQTTIRSSYDFILTNSYIELFLWFSSGKIVKQKWILNAIIRPIHFLECVRLTKLYHFIFLHLSKVWSMLHHGSVRRVKNKSTTLSFHLLFWHFFVIFHHQNCGFIIFISFFDELSNFCNRILTKQKQEFVVQNCQWNCKVKLSKVSNKNFCSVCWGTQCNCKHIQKTNTK